MEQNPPVLAKKVWNLVRVVYSMLRKGISKRKIVLDINMMIKRGKIAGKTLQNLMFNHHNNSVAFSIDRESSSSEYEFSCTNSPATSNHTFSLFSKKRHSGNKPMDDLDMMKVSAAMLNAMEMIPSETTSLALPGFGRSPVGRQLRVTDSPFPLSSVDEDNHVDEAAEQFISQFYDDLRRQNTNGVFGSS